MNATAVIVTRGDVDLTPILDTIPEWWERVVWNNGERSWDRWTPKVEPGDTVMAGGPGADLAVYGRYEAAIHHASNPIIYVQDDDCVLPTESILALAKRWREPDRYFADGIVANMPERFRAHYDPDSCLVGFGAIFERRLAQSAFNRWHAASLTEPDGWFNRVCDVIFTTLAPERFIVDVDYENLPHAEAPNRMYRQADHVGERAHALKLARYVRDN